MEKKIIFINSRTYTHTYTPTVVQGRWGGLLQPLPCVFAVLQYLRNILLLINSLSCDAQDEVNVMGYGAAGGPWDHPKWLNIQMYRKNSEIANIFC